MNTNLSGKTVIVTGAGSGLGQATAIALAEEGATVVITELPDRMDRADETISLISDRGGTAVALSLDVRSLDSITNCVDQVVAAHGRIDVLVNNAGVNIRRRAFDVSETDWDTVIDVNLKGVFFMAQAVGRQMRDQSPSGGSIINISSIMGLVGYWDRVAYCSSKAAIINMGRVLAVEWGEHNIRVNAVCPTFVETPLTKPLFESQPEFTADVMARTMTGRFANAGRHRRCRRLPGQFGGDLDHRPGADCRWRLDRALSSNAPRIAIIGAGISGLTAAHELSRLRPDASITIFEASDRVGGKLWTQDQDGFVIERGADSWLAAKPWAADLARSLGLEAELVTTNQASRGTFIARGDNLFPLPEGLSGLSQPDLDRSSSRDCFPERQSPGCAEAFVPPDRSGQEQSIAGFMRHRLGRDAYDHMVEPLLSGIYAGDGNHLSADATFPQLVQLEQQYGSLLRGLRQSNGQRKSGVKAGFISLQGGLSVLIDALIGALNANGVELRAGQPVNQIERTSVGFEINDESFDKILVATDAANAARLLATLSPIASSSVAAIQQVSTVTVALTYPLDRLMRPLSGHGYVIPRAEKRSCLAMTWMTSKWENRAPQHHAVVRVFVGRAGDEGWIDASDDKLIATALAEVQRTLGATGDPSATLVTRWRDAMPQYNLGHRKRITAFEQAIADMDGLSATGNYLRGVGIPDCIREAQSVAQRMAGTLP